MGCWLRWGGPPPGGGLIGLGEERGDAVSMVDGVKRGWRTAVLAVLAGTVAWGGEGGSSLCGVVTDLAGGAVARAQVVERRRGAAATSDEVGAYCLHGLAAGEFSVEVRARGFQMRARLVRVQARRDAVEDFVLKAGQLTDAPRRVVGGVVLGVGGRALSGARVAVRSCLSPDVGAEERSGADGSFEVLLREPGQYCVVVWAVGHEAASQTVTVPAGTGEWGKQLRVVLRRLGR